jgi:phosphohistidine phosphatase
MKRHLILIRHAQSRNVEPGEKDVDRELTDSGIQDASRLARYMYLEEIIPEVILTSHAARAKETAQLFEEQLKLGHSEVIVDEELYEASVRTLLNVITKLDNGLKSVLIIGHNPSLTHLCEHLSKDVIGFLPPASMVHMTFDNLDWSKLDKGVGILNEIKLPDQISF